MDPFGGSGTTYAVCELRDRRWIGIESDSCPAIVERLQQRAIVERLQQRAIGHHRNDIVNDEPEVKATEWPAAAD